MPRVNKVKPINGVTDPDTLIADDGRGPWLPTTEIQVDREAVRRDLEQYASKYGRQETSEVEALDHITKALQLIFPESSWDDNVQETARRVMGYWKEFVPRDSIDFNFTTFTAAPSQIILIGDITFTSICAHHLLPFQGKLHIGYKAHDVQAGLSKIPRLVEFWARRPQVQEQLTAQLMKDLTKRLQTKDVMVVCEAQHTCVSARGARLHNGVMRTSLASGLFLSSPPAREEFFSLLARNGV